jgi:diguanylate cyclase (GGDEF)-like protein
MITAPALLDEPAAEITVLLIEDDVVDEMAMLRTVARDRLPYRIEVARSVAEARRALAARTFDLILADFKLVDGTSFDLLPAFADQLVIFITGAWDEAAAASALRIGVHDYLIKDTERKYLLLLHYRVQTALRQRHTERQLRDSEARLKAILDHAPASISAHDMTGHLVLSNHRHASIVATAAPAPASMTPGLACAEIEEILTHHDGSEHTYLTVRFPIPDATGCTRAVGSISLDITARKRAEQQIRNLAYFDPLTSLPNRRMLMDRLQQAFAVSARHGGHGALFFIDLDHFKALNDSLGHDHGDMLLIEVAKRLLACVRGEDTVARLGGDEFVVMTLALADEPSAAAAQAASVGEKIVSAIGRPCQLGVHAHTVTPSVGVTLFHGRDSSVDEVIKRADVAMYQAKAAGRGTLRFFDPVMQSARDAHSALSVDLGRALAGGQFRLHLQGQVDARRGLLGAEALLRWEHPQHGLLLPAHFLALVDQGGLSMPVGQWVLDAACAQLGRWAVDPNARHYTLAVNVSERQFRDPGFARQVERCLRQHGAAPDHLRLELREGMTRQDPKAALSCMTALHAIGVGFAMDDFGLGLSSLSNLRRLPLDQIKISPSLLTRLTSDAHDAAVVRTIIGIGHELGLSVIASGVETQAQRDLLSALGCSLWQGFLFGQPIPSDEFATLFAPAASPTSSKVAAPVDESVEASGR